MNDERWESNLKELERLNAEASQARKAAWDAFRIADSKTDEAMNFARWLHTAAEEKFNK